jgi:hypothetical protein
MPTTSPLLAAFSHSEWAFPSAVLQLCPFLNPCWDLGSAWVAARNF